MATSQFHEVAETTTGTTQGNSSSTLNKPLAGIRVRSSSASARPMAQLPKTPTSVKTTVNMVGVPEGRRLHDRDVIVQADEVARTEQVAVAERL